MELLQMNIKNEYLCLGIGAYQTLQVAQTVKNLPAMQETWVQSLGQEDPLEKGMATHSSILAWIIPWTLEPGGLQSMGSQRIRHDLATIQQAVFKYLSCIIGSEGKVFACNAGDPSLIPGSGRSLEEGNSYPLQYSCLGNPMDRGAWWATVHGVAKSQMQLTNTFTLLP